MAMDALSDLASLSAVFCALVLASVLAGLVLVPVWESQPKAAIDIRPNKRSAAIRLRVFIVSSSLYY